MNTDSLISSFRNNFKTAIIETQGSGEGRFSYDDIYKKIQQRRLLLNEIGLGDKSVVILSAFNNCDFIVNLFALISENIAPIVVSPHAKVSFIGHITKLIDVNAVIFPSHKHLDKKSSDYVFVTKLESSPLSIWSVSGNKSIKVEGDNNILLLSSGTTGSPKLIVHDFNRLLLNACLHVEAIAHTFNDITLLVLPSHFSYGLVAGILANLLMKTPLVFLSQPFSFSEWSEVCEKHNVTTCLFTPFIINKLLTEKKKFPQAVKKITIGGNLCKITLLQELSLFYENDVYLTYGLTEAGPRVFTNKYSLQQLDKVYVGTPLSGISTKLFEPYYDEDGALCGELCIKTETSMLYKIDENGINKNDFVDGWLRTHDIFLSSPDMMQLMFLDRDKDLIDVAGEKISARTVQSFLLEHEAIADACVYQVKHKDWGNAFEAKIVLDNEYVNTTSLDDVYAWCNRNMRLIEIPQKIFIKKTIKKTVTK